ncbi:hypothetical protein QQ008_12885 [Fulvivirgaceae bacterium BMA10]|uniref:Tetratricopeptide repeat protein n=1 Tax=Splendidivirga corallicola TaxID=3051826 RepID=A0ABT8KPD6_9BACT|nr:hypothetical protein [Fulvivirgaceae bacterium BMA10]
MNFIKQSLKGLVAVIVYGTIVWVMIRYDSNIISIFSLPEWLFDLMKYTIILAFPIIVFTSFTSARTARRISREIRDAESREALNKPLDKSLAILPLENYSTDGDLEYFTQGLAEDLINSLSRIKDLNVVSRNSTIGFKKVLDIHDIVQKVSLKNVLEGNITRDHDRVKLAVQLKNLTDKEVIWSEVYHNAINDIFAVQHSVVKNVIEKLNVELDENEKELFSQPTRESAEAYDSFLKGRHHFNQREEGLMTGAEHYREAIAIDETHGRAHAGLSCCYNLMGFYDFRAPHEVYPRAKTAALKAIEIDPNIAEAHTSLAFTHMLYEWDWEKAEIEFLKGLELNPGFALTHHWYAEYLMAMGRFDEANKQVRKAQKNDPLGLIISTLIGMNFYLRRQYDESIAECLKTLHMDEDFLPVYIWLGVAYEQKEMYTEAIDILQKGRKLSNERAKITSLLAHTYALAGERGEAETLLQELISKADQSYVSSFDIARIYKGLGDKKRTYEWLNKALDERAAWLVWLNVNPSFDELRDDMEFKELLKNINLTNPVKRSS